MSRFLLRRVLPPAIVLLIFLLAGETIVRLFKVPVYLLPRPSDVIITLVQERAELLAALLTTGQESLLGFAASILIGIVSAIALNSSDWIRQAFYPYTVFFQTVPLVAIAPLLEIWLDPGPISVVVCTFIVSVFPIIANTLTGLRSTDPALSDLFTLYGSGRFDRLFKLNFPGALPGIFSGLRVASGLAVIGTVVSEFFVGQVGPAEGLGVKISNSAKHAHADRLFAAVLLASLLGLALFAAVNATAWLTLRRWHASESES